MPLDHWRPKKLTRRLRQSLVSMARGEAIKTAADSMGIAFKTACHHRQSVIYFYGSNCATGAVVQALKRGDITLSEISHPGPEPEYAI